LDISPYVKPDYQQYGDKSYKYRLYGACHHLGNLNGGHYVAYTRLKLKDGNTFIVIDLKKLLLGSRGDWYYISDSDWHVVDFAAVLSSAPYILFYEMIDNLDE